MRVDPRSPKPDSIAQAAEVVRSGGVVCFPTRCLYGLGADAFSVAAVERIYEIKQRPAEMPLLVLINAAAQLAGLAKRIPRMAHVLMQRFWPGRLTLVLEAEANIPDHLTAGNGKIGIRLAAHPVARALVEAVAYPITGTSANISGGVGCRQISELNPQIRREVDLILDAGPLKGGVGSTVVDVTGDSPVVIREGEVSKPEIIAALKSVYRISSRSSLTSFCRLFIGSDQPLLCRSGEIGRRRGLKILRGQLHAGSSPASGTKENQGLSRNWAKPFCFTKLSFMAVFSRF